MTNISRGLAVLTISVIAGFTAGCASADAPTKSAAAPAKKAAATAPVKKATRPAKKAAAPAKPAYCVPLAAAYKAIPRPNNVNDGVLKKYGKLLEPAAALASAAGKTDVGGYLSLVAKQHLRPGDVTDEAMAAQDQIQDQMREMTAIILKDCGINLMN